MDNIPIIAGCSIVIVNSSDVISIDKITRRSNNTIIWSSVFERNIGIFEVSINMISKFAPWHISRIDIFDANLNHFQYFIFSLV